MPTLYAAAMEYYDQWKVGASYIARATLNAYTELVAADPQKFKPTVASFEQCLREIRAALLTMRARLRRSDLPPVGASLRSRVIELSKAFQLLATDFYRDTQAQPATPSTGLAFVPVMVLGGVLAVGLGAASIGVAMNTYAESLREQTLLAREELKARYTLALENKELPPSTVPASSSPMSDLSTAVSNVLYLGVLGGVGVMAWKYFGSRNMR